MKISAESLANLIALWRESTGMHRRRMEGYLCELINQIEWPLELVVEDFLVFASQVIIRGRTEPGALLTVAGNKIDVYDDGSFTTVVPLTHEGVNTVTFIAQDIAGNEAKLERTANVDAY